MKVAGYLFWGTLAAFGALSILWALLGWILPGGKGCAVVCCGALHPEALARLRWLRSLGLLNCPVILVSENDFVGTEVEKCNEEELLIRLKQEYCRYYGTGTGDPAGRGQRRGISEL